jgi:hypothetical protein
MLPEVWDGSTIEAYGMQEMLLRKSQRGNGHRIMLLWFGLMPVAGFGMTML